MIDTAIPLSPRVRQDLAAAARLLREHVPYLRVRVVDVVDLMAPLPADDHPHGFTERTFEELFTADTDVVFAFHGYPAPSTNCCTGA